MSIVEETQQVNDVYMIEVGGVVSNLKVHLVFKVKLFHTEPGECLLLGFSHSARG